MVDVNPWETLGIAQTDDLRRIKKAYTARLKHVHPEDDPEGFQRLRQAYEVACGYARWHQWQRWVQQQEEGSRPSTPPLSPGDPPRGPPGSTAGPHRPGRQESRAFEDAAQLMRRAEELHDDAEAWGAEAAWKDLLSTESLWNLATRRIFQGWLLELLMRNKLELAPEVWCLLEDEFHWTQHTLSLLRAFPREPAEWLLGCLEAAPVDRAEQLFQAQRYEEVIARLEPLVSAGTLRPDLVDRAGTLLARSRTKVALPRLLEEVKALRADEDAWASESAWSSLLARAELREPDTKEAFQRELFDFLVENGHGLAAGVWRLLDREYSWSQQLKPEQFTRIVVHLLPAAIARLGTLLAEAGSAAEVTQWADILILARGTMEEARLRAAVELCYSAIIEHAERMWQQGLIREAVEELAPLASRLSGGKGESARALLARCGREGVDGAERLYDEMRYREAIAQADFLAPWLEGDLRARVRLLLARCHIKARDPAKAVEHLQALLRSEPDCLPALLLLGAACRDSGQHVRAAEAYRRVVRLNPGNAHAKEELGKLESQLRGRGRALNMAAPKLGAGEGARPTPPSRRDSPSADSGHWGGAVLFFILAQGIVRMLASSGRATAGGVGPDLGLAFLALVAVVGVGMAVGLWKHFRPESGGLVVLRLDDDEAAPPVRPATGNRGSNRTKAALVALVVLAAIALIWVWR